MLGVQESCEFKSLSLRESDFTCGLREESDRLTVFISNVILLVRSELLPSKGTTLPRTWNQILVLFLFSIKYIFLFTHSVRRATEISGDHNRGQPDFYPRSP